MAAHQPTQNQIESIDQVDLTEEFNLLPTVFDIIQSVQKMGDPQEMSKKVSSFRAKLQHCRELLDTVPGLDTSCEEQIELLNKHKKQLEEKSNLLSKYQGLPVFSDALAKEMI
ncbi:uncharacterized protein LOC116618005 isoform X2 [Nematostella vectensis]|uniref:uncharacterized protein LOC116618005 isoform X2 n=1 Tax=Nematostella vectensis TaxID=45351 RepID=UPI0020774BA2|nr:uncharacterized protein LOC116618005 isoform X2 [Nematostella vectensis]